MDEELHDLEQELKKLRPIPPSRELAARFAVGRPNRRARLSTWLAWAVLPAAALMAVLLDRGGWKLLDPRRPSPFKPVAAENWLLETSDEGYVTLADGTPARRLRQSYVDTITWQNPRTRASLTWSLPREEVQVIPVNFQ